MLIQLLGPFFAPESGPGLVRRTLIAAVFGVSAGLAAPPSGAKRQEGPARPDVFDAVSAQEGGDLILDRGKDRDTLMVYLDDSLVMVKRANRGKLIGVKFGADDRVFLLRRTDMKNCTAVEEAVTTPEPGVAPRRR